MQSPELDLSARVSKITEDPGERPSAKLLIDVQCSRKKIAETMALKTQKPLLNDAQTAFRQKTFVLGGATMQFRNNRPGAHFNSFAQSPAGILPSSR